MWLLWLRSVIMDWLDCCCQGPLLKIMIQMIGCGLLPSSFIAVVEVVVKVGVLKARACGGP